MATASAGECANAGKSTFELYREGKATPAIALTIQLVLAGRRWRSLLDEKLRPTGQSSARMEALAAIFAESEPRPQVDIARRLKIEGPTLTRMLDSLEKDGLVKRSPDPADRRTKRLELTKQGETVLEEIFGVADELRARLVEDLSARDADRMNTLLKGLIDKLDTGLPDPD